MDTLNNDCQLIIIKYLNLEEQFTLFEATNEEPTNRLILNLRYTWQHELGFNLDEEHFNIFDKRPELLHDFLFTISPSVQHLSLLDITLDRLKSWKNFNFPEMTSLQYRVHNENVDMTNENLVTQLLGELFPELHNIMPCGRFDLIHLTNWKQMRKLDMFYCKPFSPTDESARGISGLQMLQHLIINSEDLREEQFKTFLGLPKLRSLTLGYLAVKRLNSIIEMRCPKIESITLNYLSWKELSVVKNLINLRKLTLLNIKITSENIQDLIKGLPLLEQLDIIDSRIWRSENELWKTVACCSSLKILNISNVKLYGSFFSANRRPMEIVLNGRPIPLTLYWHDISENTLIRLYFKHPNLQVLFEPLKNDYFAYSVGFKFYPTNEDET